MEEVSGFLSTIGLNDLLEIFQKEDIRMGELIKMGHPELEGIGVIQFGPRQRIINALDSRKIANDTGNSTEGGYEEIDIASMQELRNSASSTNKSTLDKLSNDEYLKSDSENRLNLPQPETGQLHIHSNRELRSTTVPEIFIRGAQSAVSTNVPQIAGTLKRKTLSTATNQVAKMFSKILTFKRNASELLHLIYNDLKQLLHGGVLTPELIDEMTREFGDIDQIISNAIEDLGDDSCPIVITGETSAGKSSFVNLLLGEELMPQSTLSCTSTICRIHNKENKAVILTDGNDLTEELQIPADVTSTQMKELLKQYVCVQTTKSEDSQKIDHSINDYKFIDIYWPIPYLEENILIVDTPGIGPDDPELTARLFQYLPKALAFIYVLNTPNAGGVQSDRILQIQDELRRHSENEHVVVFDSQRALFICNKWDQIHEDEDIVFQTVQETLERVWTGFQGDKLFKLSTREEMQNCKKKQAISPEFEKILSAIDNMIPSTTKEKYRRHIILVKRIVEKGLFLNSARIRHSQKTQDEKDAMAEEIRKRICLVTNDASLKKQAAISKAKEYIKSVVTKVHAHMQNQSTFERIFEWTPDQLPDLTEMDEIIASIDENIMKRVIEEVRRKIRTEIHHIETFIKDLFNAECFKINEQCESIEEILLDGDVNYFRQTKSESNQKELLEDFRLSAGGKFVLAITSPIIVPTALAFGIVVGITLLPLGVGYAVQDRVKRLIKVSKYKKDKVGFAKKRAVLTLKNATFQYFLNAIMPSLLKTVNGYVDEYFDEIIPYRIEAGRERLNNIRKDMRAPREIRKQCHEIELEILPLYGQIIAANLQLFPENNHSNIVVNKSNSGSNITTSIQFKDEVIQATVKTIMLSQNMEFLSLGEIEILRRHHHQNIVTLYDIVSIDVEGRKGFNVFVECCNKTLEAEIFSDHTSFRKTTDYLKGCLEGLSYLHRSGIIHKDIRLETILIKDGYAKLSDGVSGRISLKGNIDGIPVVRAPEVLKMSSYSIEADIFQIGIVIWEAYYFKRAFDKEYTTYEDLSISIIKGKRPPIGHPFPKNAIRLLIESCFETNPELRPSASKIKETLSSLHPTFG